MSLGGAGAEITGSFFSSGLALALDVGAEEVEVTTAATGWGLGMGRAKGTSVLSSRLRSSPDTFGTLAAFASGLSFKVGPLFAAGENSFSEPTEALLVIKALLIRVSSSSVAVLSSISLSLSQE